MNPFPVVRLGGDALDECRRRVQQRTCGHRGCMTDLPLQRPADPDAGADLLTGKQKEASGGPVRNKSDLEVEATWEIYQRMVEAYPVPRQVPRSELVQAIIDAVSQGVPAALTELRMLS